METTLCPYCSHPGWVMTYRRLPKGLQVEAHCRTCGHSCSSDYSASERMADLVGEYHQALEAPARD